MCSPVGNHLGNLHHSAPCRAVRVGQSHWALLGLQRCHEVRSRGVSGFEVVRLLGGFFCLECVPRQFRIGLHLGQHFAIGHQGGCPFGRVGYLVG